MKALSATDALSDNSRIVVCSLIMSSVHILPDPAHVPGSLDDSAP